ncbi:MAG TPA: DinB family protein [Stellaceae bacterium]|nr:DinB family protein [Stellaceae bacterium]
MMEVPVLVEDFRRRSEFLHRMTVDFVAAVPDDKWNFTPDPCGEPGRRIAPLRHGGGFAPFCKQLRHVVCVRGVYNSALRTKTAEFSRKHEHYTGSLGREDLLFALEEKQRELLTNLVMVDTGEPIDFFGRAFTFGDFAFTVVQHEAIHHGQWSIYASLAGFQTPLSWRAEWGL